MPRGKRDVGRTRRILGKIIAELPYKQIAYEEKTTVSYISAVASRYLTRRVIYTYNDKGRKLMSEEQFNLYLGDPNA